MDLILFNAAIETMDPSFPSAQAVAIKNGLIEKVGSNDEILSLREAHTKTIDLDGKLLIPGFNDSHMHLIGYAYTKEKIDLNDTASLEDMLAKVEEFIQSNQIPKNTWVLGRGWTQNSWESSTLPTRYDLDKISADNPIVLVRVCGHVAVVNSKALEVLDLLDTVPKMEGGQIDVDENGHSYGIFREKALNLIYDAMPIPEIDDIKKMILNAAKDLLSKGITSVQTDDFESIPGRDFVKIIRAYEELANDNLLPIRVNEQCLLPEIGRLKEFLSAGYNTGYGNAFFKLGPLKLLTDGSLGARTALLCSPYEDAKNINGIAVFSQDQLDCLVTTAYENNMQVAVHCIGDAAMYMTFNSYEKVLNLKKDNDPRFSIIHCQITDNTLIGKYKSLHVIAHIQPVFIQSDLHMVEERVGKNRAKTSYLWKTMHEAGVPVAHGSDCPVEKFDVLPGIYCAVTRKDFDGYPESGWYPDECLSVYDAVKGFTIGAAYASFEEEVKGSITEGKYADLVVLSQNIFKINQEMIKDVDVEMTISNGVIRYIKS